MFFYVDQKYTKETGGPKVSETEFFLFFVYKGEFIVQPTLIKFFFLFLMKIFLFTCIELQTFYDCNRFKDLTRTNGANTQNFEFLFVTDCRFDQTLVVSEVKGIKGSQKGPNTQNDDFF
jgi:hypothetical protein